MSFEQPTTDWMPIDGNIASSDVHVDGAHSGSFTVTGWNAQLASPKLSSLGRISSTATLELELPASLAGQSWQGQISLVTDAPSAGVYSQHTSPVQFQNSATGSFQHVRFDLSPAVVSALSTATYSDLQLTLVFGMAPNSQPFLVDKLNLGQAPPPDGGTDAGSVTGSGASTGGIAGGAAGGTTAAGGAGGGLSGGGGATAGGAGVSGGGGAGNTAGTSGASGGTAGGGTTTGTSGPCSFSAPASGGLATDADFTIKLPHGVPREGVGIATTGGSLTLDDGVQLVKDAGGFASVSSVAAVNRTNLGVATAVQDVYTEATGVDLRSNAHVHGNVKTAADLSEQAGAVVDGVASQNTSLQPLDTIDWTVSFPNVTRGSCSLEPDNTEIIEPASYGDVAVKSRSHLKIRSGTYYFNSLSFEPQAVLDIDNTAGPVFIYVKTTFAFSGTVAEIDPDHMNFLFGVAGASDINIQSPFRGILIAPAAALALPTEGTTGHVGSFFVRAVVAHQNTVIHQRAFLPSEFCASDAACSSFCPCGTGNSCTDNIQCQTGLACSSGGTCACIPNCAGKVCGGDPSDGCGGLCPGVCSPGQGGCTTNLDCGGGMVCGIGVGAGFGLAPDANVCWDPICSHQDPSQPNCGVGTAQCGACPVCTPSCTSGSTDPDGCGGFCGACPSGQTRLGNGACADPQVFLDSLTANFPIPLPAKTTDAFGATAGRYAVTNQGTASYSIPIDVPPGRMGLQPALSLDYVSTKANGMLGLGWRLGGLSTISRCPSIQDRDGVARPVQFTVQDHFCIDGAALVLIASGGPGRGDEYRTEIDSFRQIKAAVGDGFTSDGTYVGPASFEVHTKDGRILEYGTSQSARIYSGVVVWKWALSRISDRFGNSIAITYDAHNTVGNPSLAFATYRSGFFSLGATSTASSAVPVNETGELLPKSISYNGSVVTPAGTFISFEYEDRTDPLEHYTAGAVGYSTKRLTHVKTQVGGSVVRDYQIAYEADRADRESRVTKVTECAPESGSEVCKQPTKFTYGETSLSGPGEIDTLLHAGGDASMSAFPIDANGDGLDDVAVAHAQTGSLTVAISDGTGSFAPGVHTTFTASAGDPCISGVSVLDVNNDGKDDLVNLCSNGPPGHGGEFPTDDPSAIAYISNGDGSFTQQTLPFTFAGHLSIGDIDGDGRKDFIACHAQENTLSVILTGERLGGSSFPSKRSVTQVTLPEHSGNLSSTGGIEPVCSSLRIFDADGDGSDNLFIEAAGRIMIFDWPSRTWRDWGPGPRMDAVVMADVNGDGLVDMVGGGSTTIPVWVNTGVGFVPTVATIANPLPGPTPVVFGVNAATTKALDYDGDGRQEIATFFGILRFTSLTSVEILPAHLPFYFDASTLLDVNGDGEQEFFSFHDVDSSQDVAPIARVTFLPAAARAGLLQSATDGLGKQISFSYDSSYAQPSLIGGGLSGPVVSTYTPGTPDDLTISLRKVAPLVSHVSEAQVSRDQTKSGRDFFYQYDHARLGLGGRGWYGFSDRTIQAVDPVVTTVTTLSYNNLDFRGIDLVVGAKTEWFGDAPSTPVSTEMSSRIQLDTYSPVIQNGDHQQFLFVESETHSLSENGSPIATTSVSRQVDLYGNMTQEASSTSVSGTIVDQLNTVRTFDHDPTQWLINRVSTESSTDSRGGQSVVRATHFTYTPGTDVLATVERQPDPSTFSGPNAASPTEYKLTELTREGSGNIKRVCETDSRGSQFTRCTSATGFDDLDLFPTGFNDPMGLPTQLRYRSIDGQLWWSKDPNGLVAERSFDAFGRVNQTKSPTTESTIGYSNASVVVGPDTTVWSAFQVAEVRTGKGQFTREFDAFGRLVQTFETGAGPSSPLVTTEREYDAAGRLSRLSLPHILGDRSQGVTQFTYDAFGRLVAEQAPDSTVTHYYPMSIVTASGVASSLFAPSASGEVPVAGVVVQKPRLNVETLVRDFAGNPIRSLQAPSITTAAPSGKSPADVALTSYHYGPFNAPSEIDAPIGQTVFFTDNIGRPQQVNDPALGLQIHAYDGFDEVLQNTAGNGTITNLVYDADGRTTQLLDAKNAMIAKWIYDGDGSEPNDLGRLVSTYRQATPGAATGNWTHYEYQSGDRGLLQAVSYGIGGTPNDPSSGELHTVGLEYKPAVPWQLDVLDYPSDAGAFRVGYDYDASGSISKVYPAGDNAHPYWQLLDTDQGFRPKTEAFGNGLVTTRDYYSLTNGAGDCTNASNSCLPGRLRGITTQIPNSSAAQPVQQNAYLYDVNGNLSTFIPVGGQSTDGFTYDGLDRLTSRTRFANATQPLTEPQTVESYAYDSMGNLQSNGANAYEYKNPGRPFQVTRAGDVSYDQYDGAGNPLHRSGSSLPGGSQTFEYNDFNMPWRITNGTGNSNQVEFEYDGSGSRLIKRKLSGGNVSQVALDIAELYEQVAQYSPGVTEPTQRTHQYRVYANRQVAQVTRTVTSAGTGISTVIKTVYLHDDLVGTASAITDTTGALVEQRSYSSFGDDGGTVNYSSTGVLSGFTGAEQDPDLGLTNMRGRLYDAKLGRFITPDPFVARPFNAQGLNRYAYVENNPLNFVDPSGFDAEGGTDSGMGGTVNGTPSPVLGITVQGGSPAPSPDQTDTGGQPGSGGGEGSPPEGGVGGGAAPDGTVGGGGGPPEGQGAATTSDPTSAPSSGGPGNWTAGNSGGSHPSPGSGSPQAPGTSVSDPWYNSVPFWNQLESDVIHDTEAIEALAYAAVGAEWLAPVVDSAIGAGVGAGTGAVATGAAAHIIEEISKGTSLKAAIQALNAAGASQAQAVTTLTQVVANSQRALVAATLAGSPGTVVLAGAQFAEGGFTKAIAIAANGVATLGSGIGSTAADGSKVISDFVAE